MNKPTIKPKNPNFSSGPCAKRPGYSYSNLYDGILGRSHRSKLGKGRLELSITKTRELLNLPDDYRIGIVPASDTGAFEMAMWNLLGPRPIDIFHWEAFGSGWHHDIVKELKLTDVNSYLADYGVLPDFSKANFDNDVIFTWNGTTSGVKVENGDWIADDRKGLVMCDATSAVFAMDIDWKKLDVVTYSWQKVLGGEAAHGMLILSPRAVERAKSYKPSWPLPKIFRLSPGGKFNEKLFEGSTINTPSMIANEDYIDALLWAESIGGTPALIERSMKNLSLFEEFVENHEWINFLAKEKSQRSNTSVTFSLDLSKEKIKKLMDLLSSEEVAYDFGSYKKAPAGLRFWCGGTIEASDIEALLPWLAWGYEQVK